MTDLTRIKRLHEGLYERYLTDRAGVLAKPERFAREAEDLIAMMQDVSAGVDCLEDYEWLRSAAQKWQSVFISALNIPRDVSIAAPRTLIMPAPKEERTIWADEDLEQWIRFRAFETARKRVTRYKDILTPTELLRRMPSTQDEEKSDWETATLFLASEVVDGHIELTQIRSRAYMRLEACWLDDVKRMKAYFKWIDEGDGFDPTGATEDYWSVCSEVQSRVLRADGKRPASEFNPVRDYLESRYLDNGRLDLGKAHDLIAIKAWRIWQSKGGDPVRNWLSAEQYVSDFYGHIVAAASEGDTEAARRITGAVTVSEPKHDWHLIINAFEVAIAGSFVNADFPEQLAQAQAQAQAQAA